MEKRIDLPALIKACNFQHCEIYTDGEYVSPSEEYDKLVRPNADGVAYIRDMFDIVTWKYIDDVYPVFEVKYNVEDDAVHFYYPVFNFKIKYTLVNILKSQSQWKCVGYGLDDPEAEEIVEDGWFTEEETKYDIWLHRWDEVCNEYIIESHHASLLPTEETDEEGNVVDILNLTVSTNIEERSGQQSGDEVHGESIEKCIITRDAVAGLSVNDIDEEAFYIELSPDEVAMLEGEIMVRVFNDQHYYHSPKALVEASGDAGLFLRRGTERVCIDLTRLMCCYGAILFEEWEKKDYGHNFKDFVIEVFDMRITKGKVEIHIKLGS